MFITFFVNLLTPANDFGGTTEEAAVFEVSGCSPGRVILGGSLRFAMAQKPEVFR